MTVCREIFLGILTHGASSSDESCHCPWRGQIASQRATIIWLNTINGQGTCRTDGKAVETVVTFCFIFQENERIGTIELNNPGYAVIPTSPALGTEVFINEKIEHGCTNIEEK